MSTFWRGAALPRPPSATRRLRQTEKAFRQQVVTLARLHRWHVYWTWLSVHSPAGFPDLVLARPPVLWAVELKTDHARPTDAQVEWLEVLSQCEGVRVAIWRPRDWDRIQRALE